MAEHAVTGYGQAIETYRWRELLRRYIGQVNRTWMLNPGSQTTDRCARMRPEQVDWRTRLGAKRVGTYTEEDRK